MKTDAHMHSSFSYDAEVCPKKMIEASIQKGLKAICFTDHYDKDDDQWDKAKGTISGSDRGPDRGRTWSQTASCRILQQVRSKVSI